MNVNAQHTNNAACMPVLKTHEGATAAVLLMSSADANVEMGLSRIFGLHRSPYLNIEEGLDSDLDTVGDCAIKPDGVKLVITGSGANFMGMVFETNWGGLDRSWRQAAVSRKHVWVSLVGIQTYTRAFPVGLSARVPFKVPTLKLDVV